MHAPGDSDTLTHFCPFHLRHHVRRGREVRSLCSSGRISPWSLSGPTKARMLQQRASIVVSFVVPQAATIPLRGLVDTGLGVSILTFLALDRVAVQIGAMLKPYQIDLYAAYGKTIQSFGIAERVGFQEGG